MSDFLAEQIIAAARPVGTHSAFDHQVLVDIDAMLRHEPVDQAASRSVRRAYDKKPADTIEVDCEYRAPIALVHWQRLLLAGRRRRREAARAVHGRPAPAHRHGPRPQAEHPRDLTASRSRPSSRATSGRARISRRGSTWSSSCTASRTPRRSPRSTCRTTRAASTAASRTCRWSRSYNTEIRWGRPVNSKDFFIEVSPAQKLSYLKQVYEQFHRVDAQPAGDRHPI